ncbi:SurA N-terminal domain-containing protein [Magnetospirillum moscoviense]|uniref:Parvulin-like PPIase n=1 Tax=Magnetospirillum moscoviense TaxID=1437059 RepID=A0A178N1N0_9PROT|nr:SurA N-terminal domain-containing protein [Magnetospirillum moscoviense]OAN64484.1 parvulin peptidyl-prolyl isomerase [Magnetospirillum moscoviense]
MLDSFRNASKSWVVKLLLGLLGLSFISWGVGDVLRGGLFGRGPAIEVGKVQVTAAEVNAEFKREVARLQPLFGGKLSAEEARKMGLLDRTIQTIVTRTLIDEAARRLGLSASEDAVVAQVAADPNFRNERGEFDRELLRRALNRANLSESDYMRMEKSNMVRAQMAEALSGGLVAPVTLADPLTRWREERRAAEIAQIKDEAVALPAAPDQAAIEQYYKDHSTRFMAPEFRALTVMLLRPADVGALAEITDAHIAEAYQLRLDEFVTPERRQVAQVVLADDVAAARATDLVKAGKDLAAIAKDLGASVVDLGTVEKGELPDELGTALFAQKPGTISAPVRTALGWHVAQVGQVTPGRTRPLAEVKSMLEQDLRRERSTDLLSQLANQVEDTLGAGTSLEETASRFQLKVLRIPAIDAKGQGPNGKPVADAPKSDTFLDVAFHTEQGAESQLTEKEGDGYFLVRVDRVVPPAPRALADVRAEVVAGWQAERRHEKAGELAKAIAEQVKAGEPLAKVAQAHGIKVVTSAPFTREGAEAAKLAPAVVADLFQGKSGTVAVKAEKGGWVVARLAQVIAFEPAKDAKATETARRKISSTVASDLVDQYLAALNVELGVRVDRSQISREE